MSFGVFAIRLSKVLLTAGLALFAFLATLNNVVDYDSNWAYVQHVLAMDTVFPESTLRSRAIADPGTQRTAYLAIIITEGLTCFGFLIATCLMAARLNAPKAAFQRAKAWTAVGVIFGFGLWFTGFMAIGGEWFVMWQSETWNGQSAAYRFYMTILAAAIYIFLDNDGEPA